MEKHRKEIIDFLESIVNYNYAYSHFKDKARELLKSINSNEPDEDALKICKHCKFPGNLVKWSKCYVCGGQI